MLISEALNLGYKELRNSSTPNLDSRLLLMHASSLSLEELLLSYNQHLSDNQESVFLDLLNRRKSMEPMAYILGMKEFYGLEFEVNPSTLIPRPDTELLIDVLLDDYNSLHKNREVLILELGTGSGAIAVTVANKILKSKITATDISKSALKVSYMNAKNHNLLHKIQFIKSDWYHNLKADKYDYIISNPPYISEEENSYISRETYLFEPKIALYAKNQGLACYEKIIKHAKQYLKNNGKLLLEIGYSQTHRISSILLKHEFHSFKIHKDIAGHDRVIIT